MIQPTAIFFSAIFIVTTTQRCCPSSPAGLSQRSLNIFIPIPYHSKSSDVTDYESRMGGNRGGLDGRQSPYYFGYFTRYLGRASPNRMCPAGININGQCWYDSIGNER